MNTNQLRWTIISDPYMKQCGKYKHKFVKCKCSCNKIQDVRLSSLKGNKSKSCGCLKIENSTKHGLSKHLLYKIWKGIKSRCYNKNVREYKWYGGKGISVCKSWLDDFENFYNDNIKLWKSDLTIDRKDSNKNYEPDNCRWISLTEQQNNRSNNHLITIFGETKNLKQWSKDNRCVINYKVLVQRIRANWNPEKALTVKSERVQL